MRLGLLHPAPYKDTWDMALTKHSSTRQMVVVDLTNDTDDDEDEEPIAFASQAVAPSIISTPLPNSFGLPAATTFVPRLYSTDATRPIPLQRPCPTFVSQTDNFTRNGTIPHSHLSATASSDNTAIHSHGQWTEVSRNHVPILSTTLVHGIKKGVSPERPAKKMRTMMSHGQAFARLPQNSQQDNVMTRRIQGQDSFVQPGWMDSTQKKQMVLNRKLSQPFSNHRRMTMKTVCCHMSLQHQDQSNMNSNIGILPMPSPLWHQFRNLTTNLR